MLYCQILVQIWEKNSSFYLLGCLRLNIHNHYTMWNIVNKNYQLNFCTYLRNYVPYIYHGKKPINGFEANSYFHNEPLRITNVNISHYSMLWKCFRWHLRVLKLKKYFCEQYGAKAVPPLFDYSFIKSFLCRQFIITYNKLITFWIKIYFENNDTN